MTPKEDLIGRIEKRIVNRQSEIGDIPIPWMRKWYQRKMESNEKLQEYFLELGDLLLKYFNGSLTRSIFYRLNAWVGPLVFKRQFRLGKKSKDFFDSVTDYYMFLSSYGAWPVDIAEVSTDRVVMYLDKCTVKLENHPELCLAATSMEPELSKKPYFGATITYTERIPEGAKRCKVVFVRK
jgi:hypothetical protein